MHKFLTIVITAVLSLTALKVLAKEYNVEQINKQFSVKSMNIKVGDRIRFTNMDPYLHNVYSFSPNKIFDLGSYPRGKYREVFFDTPGQVVVECAIHPEMTMTINVGSK